jgi:outer membrane protein assembly factor BamB
MHRCRRLLVFVPLIASASILAVPLHAAPRTAGTPVWEDIVNLGFYRTDGSIAGIENGRLYAVINGNYTDSPSSNARVIVRAYDARAGIILWTDTWDVSPWDDSAVGAVSGDIVLVAASTMLNSTEPIATYSVRAYDGRSGTVLWSDECGPGVAFGTGARNVVALGSRFFVAGACQGNGFLRAYEAGTGTVAWETETFPFRFSGPFFPPMAASGGQVFLLDSTPTGEWLVRSFDAGTGQVLWASDSSFPIGPGSRMLAAGAVVVVSSQNAVRGFDSASGATLWEVNFGDISTFPDLVNLRSNRLTVAVNDGVSVYDARTGALLSEDPDAEPLPGIVRGNLRYVAGSRIPLEPPMGMREFFLQAFRKGGPR